MIDFTVLVLPGSFASSVALTLDILSAAASLAERVGCAKPRWCVYSAEGGDVQLSNGLKIEAKALPKTIRSDGSVWVIPGLGVDNPRAIMQLFTQPEVLLAMKALQGHARAGGTVAASCSAVFLLQSTGLLVGRKVTTSWWLAPLLQRMEPRCMVDADRMVISDGAVVTAGAAFAQTDLMLHLLRTRFSPALSDAVSRALLIDGRQSQAQFIAPAMFADGNELIARLVTRFELSLPNPPSVSVLAAEFSMSDRTLSRHVRAATGRSTSALLQSVRLSKARVLLETSKLTVEQVAERVGYADTTALRRLMRKAMGATPRQFRPAVSD
ncbi:GlxA family transcriptional regulator [Solimicrobium silvestre]|uniref:Transcriptional regulator containing an amidase domain and an AraC-type DNA-binding HTH domain n=1 Tax=Solimicrobium silvestre TaxID=2099400 RepID=A0A2S9H5J7_9BURK|nr:helix-turn-helix domain-containing protein [Solimicrobium silvestre]PRC95247.1 Transcriptional regulator containing an amidase domain and an AraC-type DNA-binding HTH domain [Solimicrobium silvestre]